jgi:toxin ParE1/3/4
MTRILRTPEARQDILDIWSYIARENAPSVADAVLARLEGAIEIIAQAPFIGPERPEFSGCPRSMTVRPYIIFYEPLPEGDGILLWRILHGSRDLTDHVRPPGGLSSSDR